MKRRKSKQRNKGVERTLEKFGSNLLRKKGLPITAVQKTPGGQVKISELLEEFIEPLLDDDFDAAQLRRALQVGVLAWNASLFSPELCGKFVDKTVDQAEASKKEAVRRL